MQLTSGYMISSALYPVTKLGIAELLSDGPQPVSKLAADSGSHEHSLYRVLRALSNVGIFAEVSPRTFGLTPAASLLRCDVAGSRRDLVLWMTNEFHMKVWGQMMHSVLTGQPAIEKVYGKACFDVFPDLPETNVEFNNAMTNISAMTIPAVIDAYDFSGIGTIVDVAGGHGLLVSQILKHYPDIQGILFDMPHVIEGAKPRIQRLGLSSRLQTVSGDFFQSVPTGGDMYVMQHIIHDWEDAKAIAILKNTRRALEGKKNGKLILLESLVASDGMPDFTKWLDLEMLMMPGGRERTGDEYRKLLEHSGFKLTRTIPLRAMVSIIEAVPE